MSHLDKLGFEVAVGNFVCANYGSEVGIFKVLKLTPKMINLVYYAAKPRSGQFARTHRRYAQDTIKLTDEQEKALLFKIIKGNV